MPVFDDVESILFCDETKFYLNNGDIEDAIFYFAVAAPKGSTGLVTQRLDRIIEKHNVQAPVFHSTVIFDERLYRKDLMEDLCDLIIRHRLHCFCSKYDKRLLFEPTKILSSFNDNNIINFDKAEFQALFWFISLLNTHLRDDRFNFLKREIIMFFDRNVYGKRDTEGFNFPDPNIIIKQMTFVAKDKIRLLALPDFWGYIFRKSKISFNKVQAGDLSIEKSPLTINSYFSLKIRLRRRVALTMKPLLY